MSGGKRRLESLVNIPLYFLLDFQAWLYAKLDPLDAINADQ